MRNKICIILTVIALTFLFVGAVSAADNTATDTVKIKEKQNKEIINEKQTQSTNKNKDISKVHNNKVASNSDYFKVLNTVKYNYPKDKSVLKSKKIALVIMKVKYYTRSKKIGKYKIKTKLDKVHQFQRYTNYLNIWLYKNGKQLRASDYLSTYLYEKNGKWRWWPKWRHGGGTIESFHRYINDNPIAMIAVAFIY